jgi:PAS domain S-box-containing protein
LQQLLDSSPAAIYCAEIKDNGALVYTYMSENIKKILGFEPQETLFDAGFWSKQIFPADRNLFVTEDLPTLYQDGVVASEYRFKNRAGSFRWIHDEMKLICDSEGKPREIVGYLVDTTERKQVEEALMIKHSAMASLAHPMILTDQELTMVYLNDAAIEAWGADKPEEVIGKSLEEIIGSRQRFQKILRQVTEEGSWRGDLTIPRRDGKALDARMAVNRVKDDMGITCYIVSIDDVSEQRESERESKKYRSMLERMVVKRTSEIGELQKKLQEETKLRKQLEKMLAKEKKEASGRPAQKAGTMP